MPTTAWVWHSFGGAADRIRRMDGRWQKLGLVFPFEKHRLGWMHNRATLPAPILLDDVLRVYFTTREETGFSRVSFFDLEPDDPTRVLAVHEEPVIAVGAPGTFDDSGTMCDSVVQSDDGLLMYYTGYSRASVPHSRAIGLAVSTDGGVSFEKARTDPLLGEAGNGSQFTLTPRVLREAGSFHMWYSSRTGWLDVGGQLE